MGFARWTNAAGGWAKSMGRAQWCCTGRRGGVPLGHPEPKRSGNVVRPGLLHVQAHLPLNVGVAGRSVTCFQEFGCESGARLSGFRETLSAMPSIRMHRAQAGIAEEPIATRWKILMRKPCGDAWQHQVSPARAIRRTRAWSLSRDAWSPAQHDLGLCEPIFTSQCFRVDTTSHDSSVGRAEDCSAIARCP